MEQIGSRASPEKIRRLAGLLNSIRFKDLTGEIEFFGEKAILLRRDALKVIRSEIERNAGPEVAAMITRMTGYSLGNHEGVLFLQSAKSNGLNLGGLDVKHLATTLEELNIGFGKIRLVALDPNQSRANVKVENCFEALENGRSGKEKCSFMTGFLEGFFTAILGEREEYLTRVFGEKMRAREMACKAQGAQACEFELAPSFLA